MTALLTNLEWIFDDSPLPDPHGKGEAAVKFIRALKHPKSKLPGNAFDLSRWQERIVRRCYGVRIRCRPQARFHVVFSAPLI